ncbi:glycosyltransferase [uncultured Christiangramia sp.]|uniref:glycosyltransferase family 2 protein n=1 Tax=Christiangramia sp. 3-2217-3z TaxID=3417564 RepID=UPI0026361839|nr:glycosyltransferase [uncultured Christiangramia sp.]
MDLKEYKASNGDILLYCGNPKMDILDELAMGPGDLWHSSLDQGFKDVFPELVYQIAVFWWFLNDFPHLDRAVNWRINPEQFVVRKEVWELFGGFPRDYRSETMPALDLGFRMLRYGGAIPLYIKGLYPSSNNLVAIPAFDRYIFFKKNFKREHAYNMLLKEGLKNPFRELKAYLQAQRASSRANSFPLVPPRELKDIKGQPEISVVIPTMFRQEYTLRLLQDYEKQEYPVKEVIIIDATPKEERKKNIYNKYNFSYNLIVRWQKSKGSCRARNEAIEMCTGDYIIFADDDTRIPSDFTKNHIKLLQTYNVEASNGLDIMAKKHTEGLEELKKALKGLGQSRWKVGAAQTFSNANSCVKKDWVKRLGGNDVNFDGGYGEDSDFGFSLLEKGAMVIFNPFSANLHLKPPSGGYRYWGIQGKILGKRRKKQAWELDRPVRYIRPVPSPTILYGIIKHFNTNQIKEYRSKYFFLYLFKNPKRSFFLRLFKMPYKMLQFKRAMLYARNLNDRGVRFD